MSMEEKNALQSPVNNEMDNNNNINSNNCIITERISAKEVLFICNLCQTRVRSQVLLQRHLNGKKHRMRVERQGKTFFCETCQVTANSEKQLILHLNSSKHKYRYERKLRQESMSLSGSVGIWIILMSIVCVFIIFLIIFKMYL